MSSKSRSALVAGAVIAACALMPIQPAAADSTVKVDSNCDFQNCTSGDLDLHYNSIENDGYYSGVASFYGNIPSYYGQDVSPNGAVVVHYLYVFGNNVVGEKASGTGLGVKNAAASVENCAQYDSYRVYYNSSYQGASQYFADTQGSLYCAGGKIANLNSTLKNQNASQHFA
ncbi:hypothetical protein [Streptomyces sp. LN785]|uniref:hypothetical protein n=1 Tax=Streptomyces sp. LN785 TaxID=3112983 RepID=UPI003722C5DE